MYNKHVAEVYKKRFSKASIFYNQEYIFLVKGSKFVIVFCPLKQAQLDYFYIYCNGRWSKSVGYPHYNFEIRKILL